MKKWVLRVAGGLVLALVLLVVGFLGHLSWRFASERRAADERWQRRTSWASDFGSVKRLRILPLIEAAASDASLKRGIGVSYLIQADEKVILFDVGGNPAAEKPVPVLTNATRLGVDLGNTAFIVISHLHFDHVGDLEDLLATPQLSERLSHVEVFLPAPLQPQRANYRVMPDPAVLAPGVVTTGAISKAYWGMGTVVEQALAINVEGKGIVVVSGCGHQSLERLLARSEQMFGASLYGVVGGLHYPVTGFPGMGWFGSFATRLVASGDQPWHGPLGKSDVRRSIARIAAFKPGLVALSPHDSGAWTLGEFRRSFGDCYREIEVGHEIVIP